MNEKRMQLEEHKKAMGKIKLFYVIWNGIMIISLLSKLSYIGIGGVISEMLILVPWNYIPTVVILYVAKVRQIYPGISVGQAIGLASLIHNRGDWKTTREFDKLWRRCLLIVPVAKELAEDKRKLELQAAAAAGAESPKIADL